MQQLLHLLIVDRDRRQGLATASGARWLLPIVCCHERMRAGPPVVRWLAEHGLTGHVVGQWLGRIAPTNDAMDWLLVVDARVTIRDAAPPDTRWIPLAQLKSSASLLDYQHWAVNRALPGDQPIVAGPFGSMTWFDDVRDWMNVVAGPLTGSPVCYRATPYEVVLGIAAARGMVYFKGLTGDRVVEATLTSTLAEELPESFARTVAIEKRADESVWWLTEQCSGTTLSAEPTRERTVLVAANLARLQRSLRGCRSVVDLAQVDIAATAEWSRALFADRTGAEVLDACDEALARVCRTVNAVDLPRSWVPLDLDAGNVLIEGERVRFIDVDQSHIGAAPLACSTLLRRLRRTGAGLPLWPHAGNLAYEQSWTPRLDLRNRWSDLEIAAVLLECHLGWRQLSRKSERGEVHGFLDLAAAATAQRLARALDGGRHTSSAHGSR